MNIRDLKYIVKVAETGSFARAADLCNVSQPALSMQIKKFEEELDVIIFERGQKKFLITPIGAEIVAKAKDLLRTSDEITELAKLSREEKDFIVSQGADLNRDYYDLRINAPTSYNDLDEETKYEVDNILAKADGKGLFNKADGITTRVEMAKLSNSDQLFLRENGIDMERSYANKDMYPNGVHNNKMHDKALDAAKNLRGGEVHDVAPQTLRLTASQERAVGEILREHFDGAGFWRHGDGQLTAKDMIKGSEKHGVDLAALRQAGIRVDDVISGKVTYDLDAPAVRDQAHASDHDKKHK